MLICSRTINEQNDEDGVNKYEAITMEENHDTSIIENGMINRSIHETFSLVDDNFDDVHDVLLIVKSFKPLYEGLRKILSFLFCYW